MNLSTEKQNILVDAALQCFGANGYRKTSVSDIAAAAGISKAMVFHYFGTKKALYLYLIELCGRTVMDEVEKKSDPAVTDFFDRVLTAASIKISVLKKHSGILAFLNSAYLETDGEIRPDIQAVFENEKWERFRLQIVFDGMDASKFKKGVDPKLVYKMLIWFGYGYTAVSPEKVGGDLDAVYEEFDQCIRLLKKNLYKSKYLK